MVGPALLLTIVALAIWATYGAARLFPSLRNRTCKTIAIVCPILITLLVCYPVHDPLRLLGGPIQMLSGTWGKELLGIFLGLWALFTFPTIMLIFLAGSLRMSLVDQDQRR
jgi:hypothetical protein